MKYLIARHKSCTMCHRVRTMRGVMAQGQSKAMSSSSPSSRSTSSALSKVAVILCRPQGPQNVGAIARSMCNFGLEDLRVVKPRQYVLDAWDEECAQYAVFAQDILQKCQFYDHLEDAIQDCNIVLGTCAMARKRVPAIGATQAGEYIAKNVVEGQQVALVLGNERFGLSTEELRLVSQTITIPTHAPRQKLRNVPTGPRSLNLSHAGCILFYEIFNWAGKIQNVKGVGTEQSSRGLRLLDHKAKSNLKDTIIKARRLLDATPLDTESINKLSADDEENLTSLISRNNLSAKDTAVLFSISNRIIALSELVMNDGRSLLDPLVQNALQSHMSAGAGHADLKITEGELKKSAKAISPSLSLSKEEVHVLLNLFNNNGDRECVS